MPFFQTLADYGHLTGTSISVNSRVVARQCRNLQCWLTAAAVRQEINGGERNRSKIRKGKISSGESELKGTVSPDF